MLASLILGSECILDIPTAALYISNLGRAVAGIEERLAYKGGARYHWSLPGSTHCWEYERERGLSAIRSMHNATYSATGSRHSTSGTRGLKVVMNRLSADNQGMAYRKTFFTGDDIARSGYDIGTSPLIYPGQTVSASVYLSVGDGVTAQLFVRDYYTKQVFCGDVAALSAGGGARLTFTISCPEPVLLDRLGVLFAADTETSAVAYLDRLDWSGAPDCILDLTRENPMTGWSYLRGRWFGRAGSLNGSHYGKDAEAYTGLQTWTDYSYKVRLRPHCGERHRILFRVRGAQRSYAFGLAPNGRVAFEKNWQGYEETASAPFDWDLQREYTLSVEVRGNRMTGSVDGKQVLEWEDPASSWSSGCVGLGVKNGRTMYLDASVRPTV